MAGATAVLASRQLAGGEDKAQGKNDQNEAEGGSVEKSDDPEDKKISTELAQNVLDKQDKFAKHQQDQYLSLVKGRAGGQHKALVSSLLEQANVELCRVNRIQDMYADIQTFTSPLLRVDGAAPSPS